MEDRWSDIDLQRTRSHFSDFNTSVPVPLFVKIDQEMGLYTCVECGQRQTDARENDFIICPSRAMGQTKTGPTYLRRNTHAHAAPTS